MASGERATPAAAQPLQPLPLGEEQQQQLEREDSDSVPSSDSDDIHLPPSLYDRPWVQDPQWSSYTSEEKEERLKKRIDWWKWWKADSQSRQSQSEEEKAEVQGRIASSGETGELLQQLERAEEMTKGRKEKVEHCERIISENQQRLGSVQEGRKRSREVLESALLLGFVYHWLYKVIIIGPAGAGKSHVKALLLDEPPPAVRHSTPCAERPTRVRSVSHMKVMAEGGDWLKVNQAKLLDLVGNTLPQFREQLKERLTKMPPAGSEPPTSSSSSSSSNHPPQKAQAARLQKPKSTKRDTASERAADIATAVVFQKLIDKITSLQEGKRDDSEVESLLNSKLIHFIDSGGQPQFLEMFRIFLHKATTSVCVLRLSERLDEQPTVEYYKNGELLGQPHPAAHTNEEIIKCLTRSMQSGTTSVEDGAIVVVGTHLDKVHECSESLQEKNATLFDLLTPVVSNLELYNSCGNEVIFPVNAKEPGEHEKEVAAYLRKLIERCTPEATKLPIWWYVLELMLQQLSGLLKRGVLSYDECLRIAHKLKFDEEAFREALKYLHELNLFLYYPTILPKVVFSDPQLPLDKLTELVQRSYELRSGTKARGDWLMCRDRGIVQEQFLHDPHFSAHYVEGLFSPSDLLKLFQKLSILAPLSQSEYLMPCLLETLPPARLEEHRSMGSEVSPLLIHFPHGWPRNGVFCCLVAHLLNRCKWRLSLQSGRPLLVTKNCIKFRVPGSPPCSVALIDSFAYYEVHVHVTVPLSECQHLYSSIRQTLLDGVEAASRVLHYNNAKPYAAIFCPHHHRNQAGMLCTAHFNDDRSYWECSADEEHVGKTTAHHTTWFLPAVACVGDVGVLMELLSEEAGRWELFLGQLGVSEGVRGQIKLEHAGKPEFAKLCLQSGLDHWLQSDPRPTYQRLSAVLRGSTVTNRPLALEMERLAAQHMQGTAPQNASATAPDTGVH